MGPMGPPADPPIMTTGYTSLLSGAGIIYVPVIEIETALYDDNGDRMEGWRRGFTTLELGDKPAAAWRIDGPVFREVLFEGSAPKPPYIRVYADMISDLKLGAMKIHRNPGPSVYFDALSVGLVPTIVDVIPP